MRKCVFVLRTNNYFPELCRWTLPTIKLWAEIIGASYQEITEVKYAIGGRSPTVDKLQVWDLGRLNFWNILVDADFMFRPDLPDFTKMFNANEVLTHYGFDANQQFQPDRYFIRDGRNIGIAGGFVCTSHLTHELWEPPQTEAEWKHAEMSTRRKFILDEYVMSRNLAKYGLKNNGVEINPEIKKQMVHLGVEGKDNYQKKKIVQEARALALKWANDYPRCAQALGLKNK